MSIKVRITRLRDDAQIPKYETPGSVGFDFVIVEDDVIEPGEFKVIPTGLVVCVPDGYMLMIASRSSLPKRKGLMLPNSVGIIDKDYCGPEDELTLQLYNFTEKPVEIKTGERPDILLRGSGTIFVIESKAPNQSLDGRYKKRTFYKKS